MQGQDGQECSQRGGELCRSKVLQYAPVLLMARVCMKACHERGRSRDGATIAGERDITHPHVDGRSGETAS